MKQFKDLNIEIKREHFVGEKLKIGKVLNKKIKVLAYKVENSKYTDMCLHLQIEINNTKHVVFTGSKTLKEQIQQVTSESFPFETTIIEDDNNSFLFT